MAIDSVTDELTLRNNIAGAVAAHDHAAWQVHVIALADYLESVNRPEDAFLVRVSPFPRHKSSNWPDVARIPNISEHQRGMLAAATARPVGILGGSPGSGKTWTGAALICEIVRLYGHNSVCVCAPTGKAACRTREQLEAYQTRHPQGYTFTLPQPKTIHRTLEVGRNGYDGDGWGFAFNRKKPMPYQFIIVEESSMADLPLAHSLLQAVRDGGHVLFIGDLGQLPPVGHGSPLRDMIEGGVPYAELTELQRHGGKIASTCAAIRRGGEIVPSEVYDRDAGENYRHFEVFKADKILDQMLAILGRFRESGKFNPISDVQVLSALNESGPLARQPMNLALQEFLNPKGQRAEKNKYRVGDKIICTRNGHYRNAYGTGDDGSDDSYVANGEVGMVVDVEKIATVATFGNASVRIAGDDRECFDLGWCITVHRFQGSEAPVVLVPIDPSPGANMVCGREWWYTALSRAKLLSVTVGKLDVLRLQARRAVLARRKTFLAERIRSGLMREVTEAAAVV